MANAANSPFVKHPALLALFAPRPPPPFKTPMPTKPMGKLSGIAQFTIEFKKDTNEPPPNKFETPTERKIRLKKEKGEKHLNILADREKNWDPHNNPKATKDPYKTLFVARLSYELTEEDLRREFERYGRIREVKLITDKTSGKSRGYAFIEFERSNDLKEAFQHADGHKLKGRRILVDVERGRTVKTWKPRKLGGGLGKTRAGPKDDHKSSGHGNNNNHSSRGRNNKTARDRMHSRGANKKDGKYSSRRDKYRDRDFRDRDRRSSRNERKEVERSSRTDRGRKRSRSRERNKERNDRDRSKRDRGKKDEKDRDRSKTDRGDRDRSRTDKMNERGGGSGRNDRDRSRTDRDRGNNNVKYDNNDRDGRMNGRKDRDNKDDRSSRRKRSRSKDRNKDRRR